MTDFIEIEETSCGWTDVCTRVCTYVATDGRTFETDFIRSTLSKSRPNNVGIGCNSKLMALSLQSNSNSYLASLPLYNSSRQCDLG